MAQRKYEEVVMVGKSIGTLSLSCALENQMIPANTKLIWFTPLLKDEFVSNNIKACKLKSLYIIGSDDPHYNVESIRHLVSLKHNTVMVVDGANHSLEVEGKDTAHNIAMLHAIAKRVSSF